MGVGGAQAAAAKAKSPSSMCTVCVETSFWSPELCAELMRCYLVKLMWMSTRKLLKLSVSEWILSRELNLSKLMGAPWRQTLLWRAR